jgi:hypothetical protein
MPAGTGGEINARTMRKEHSYAVRALLLRVGRFMEVRPAGRVGERV